MSDQTPESIIDRQQSFVNRRNILKGALLVVLVGGAIAGFASTLDKPEPTAGVCESELGDEWEAKRLVDIPDTDHYHVECTRSTGLLSSENKWVTVSKTDTANTS